MPDPLFANRRILVVEDEYMLAMDLEQELRGAGALVLGPAPTVDAALALLKESGCIDGALLDVNLAGEMIFPVVDALLERGVPIVLTTGYDQRAIPERYAHVPCCEKPVDVRRVALTLARAVTA